MTTLNFVPYDKDLNVAVFAHTPNKIPGCVPDQESTLMSCLVKTLITLDSLCSYDNVVPARYWHSPNIKRYGFDCRYIYFQKLMLYTLQYTYKIANL